MYQIGHEEEEIARIVAVRYRFLVDNGCAYSHLKPIEYESSRVLPTHG